MAAVDFQVMSSQSIPLDYLHQQQQMQRPPSVHSVHSVHSSPGSRPHSSQGGPIRMVPGGIPLPEGMYPHPYNLVGMDPAMHYSPGQSHLRPTHLRARAAASPYSRDSESVHSSSSEADDMAMFLGHPPEAYHHVVPMYAAPQTISPNPEAFHAAGAFNRMTLSPDQGLEKLAANVRAATTTSASDRAKQIFVQAWLTANYATYPDGNVPRQGLYFSYRRVCDQYGIPHINTATLGKAIRLCFPTIKTRRLGVRGNSKYHYCGIRPATSAEAEWLQDYIQKSNNNAAQNANNNNGAGNEQGGDGAGQSEGDDDDEDSEDAGSAPGSKRNSLILNDPESAINYEGPDITDKTPTAATLLSHAQAQARPSSSASFHQQGAIRRSTGPGQSEPVLAGTPPRQPQPTPANSGPNGIPFLAQQQSVSVRHLPNFPSIEEAVSAGSTSQHSIAGREVWSWFQDHLDALLESVRLFRFDQFEMNIRSFWGNLQGQHKEVVHAPAIAGLMARADALVYDEILEILRGQMLSPIPAQSMNGLRQLALKMEKVLLMGLEGYGNTFVEPKVELGARFGHIVLRFLDIYQVTQALTTVLTNQKQLAEMRASWRKVDFDSVRNQSALVCNCRHEDLVQLLEGEFPGVLDGLAKSTEPVRDVMAWADKCCERLMGTNRFLGPSEERSSMSSRSVLIRWGYVTSQVMRDLTIRSDPAFGAFQILKLFLDDWIAVSVLRSVALSTNSVAASVEPTMQESSMQQQYFALSPMAGQESFNTQEIRPPMPVMTPTTSSMLAALQQESFSSLDPSGTFTSESFTSLSYMDPSQSDSLSFDFPGSGNTFDVPSFGSSDIGLNGSTSEGESDHESSAEPVVAKTEQP